MPNEDNLKSYQHYFISAIAIPVFLFVISLLAIYFLTSYLELPLIDKIVGYLFVWIIFLYQRFKIKLKWMEFPDGKYYYNGNIKSSLENPGFPEPDFYENEFYYSKNRNFTNLGLGILLIGVSYFFVTKGAMLYPILLFLTGIYFIFDGLRGLFGGPRIKISQSGIWTKEYGFYPWSEIKSAQIKKELETKTIGTYLEIFLKNSPGSTEYPTFKISISEIMNSQELERLIEGVKC